jgi:hypothetical protein
MRKRVRIKMGDPYKTTTFRSRGKLTGLLRDEVPAGAGQNRASRLERRNPAEEVDEAIYYRARLILGDSLPRPGR